VRLPDRCDRPPPTRGAALIGARVTPARPFRHAPHMLFIATADTVITAVTLVIMLICLCIIGWARTHPHPRRDREEALQNYARRVAQDKAERED
jgi:hypothetical protein